MNRGSLTSTWICLILAWLLFLIPIPGTVLIGGPLNLAAFILAIVVMSNGRVVGGLIALLSSLIISPIIYFLGLAIFTAVVAYGVDESATQQILDKNNILKIQP